MIDIAQTKKEVRILQVRSEEELYPDGPDHIHIGAERLSGKQDYIRETLKFSHITQSRAVPEDRAMQQGRWIGWIVL